MLLLPTYLPEMFQNLRKSGVVTQSVLSTMSAFSLGRPKPDTVGGRPSGSSDVEWLFLLAAHRGTGR